MNQKEVSESELLVAGIREIPFRYMARQNNIGENMFIERMQRIECPYRFFLQHNCEWHFMAIGNILSVLQTDRIQHRTNENEKKKKLQLGIMDDSSPNSSKSYSDVLAATYSRKKCQTTTLLLNLNVKFKPEMIRRNVPVMTEQQIRDKWSNKIITGVSEEFKAYHEIEECDLNFELPNSVLGIHHRSLVDIFLEDFRRDENEIYNEILVPGLKALLEKSYAAGQQGHNYYKTFLGPTLHDFPILPVPLIPQTHSPTPSVVSVNASLNSNSCTNIPRISIPTRSLSMHTLYQKAKIQSQNKRQFNKRSQRITRKK
ncbi:unnamed protein product [Diamesa serratosioi]